MQWAKDKYTKAMEYKKMAEDMVDDVKNSKEYKIAMLSKEVAEETKELKKLIDERKAKIKAVEEKYAVEEEVNKAKKTIAEENYRTELEILKNQEADDAEQGALNSLSSKQEIAAIKEPIKTKAAKESIKEIPSAKGTINKAENANVKQQKVKAEHSLLPKDSMVSESKKLMRTTGGSVDNNELLPAEVEAVPNTVILENGKAAVEKINQNKAAFQENNVKAGNAEEGAIKDFQLKDKNNDVLSSEVKESSTSINNIKNLKKSKGRFNT